MEISEAAPSSIAGDHPPSTKKIEHHARPPLPAALVDRIISPALAADAPRAFHRRCSSAIGARARRTAHLKPMRECAEANDENE
jgi:hypothetical protein